MRKQAIDRLTGAQKLDVGIRLLPRVFSNSTEAALALPTNYTAAINGFNAVMDARKRLHRYNSGNWGSDPNDTKDYDPHKDITTLHNFINNPALRKNYNKVRQTWLNAPKGSYQRRIAQQLDNAIGMGSALGYAANNKEAFNKFNSFRGMGVLDYLLDSADNNYKLLQYANGPMGSAFMSPEQIKKIKDNYGLMKFIWRFKKFFSDFGNWKYVDDPEVAASKMKPVDYTKTATPYWTPKAPPTSRASQITQKPGEEIKKSIKRYPLNLGLNTK